MDIFEKITAMFLGKEERLWRRSSFIYIITDSVKISTNPVLLTSDHIVLNIKS